MANATGKTKKPLRVAFDRRLKLEFHGARITSDGGLLAYRELDDTLDLTRTDVSALAEGRRGTNIRHRLLGLLRQAVYGRLAGYEDVNDAERRACDPAMRATIGREGLDRPAASSSEMGRFETEWLATDANLAALTTCRVPGSTGCTRAGHRTASSSTWTARRARPGASRKARPTTATSAAPATTRCSCSTSSAIWSGACCAPATFTPPRAGAPFSNPLLTAIAGAAGFAKPELYELLEAEGIGYTIRLPANPVLQARIGHLLTRPVRRPPKRPQVFHASFSYQAQSWTKPRRVVAKVEWHQGELYPRVGFIVTNLTRPAERVGKFYNGRSTAEQWIKERQAGAALDAAVLPYLPGQRGASPAVRARLQPRQFPVQPRAAERGGALVAEHAPGEAGRLAPGSSPWALRHLPAGCAAYDDQQLSVPLLVEY
jgi:hypothetical protein